ncbi:MAG: single-stranded-DNA-specific exonuclease RecJ [Candidatus Polarisedimenticolaceae bacterium]|nr:single-stranded-DNA-specific exonuclease RecJ [Candidatus Polarisedimenticolaceae bacterium]
MNRQIIRRTVSQQPTGLPQDLHPLLKRLYISRGITHADELDRTLQRLPPASLLSGIDVAVALLAEQLKQGGHILIVADYDADGATSCALAVRALTNMGASQVSYLVPNRFEYGYGLTPEIVDLAAKSKPDLIVTVDNGISSIEGVARANELGIPVLVTDHHLPGRVLPDAAALLNPNLPGDRFPSKHLAGVGVIFYLMLALRSHLREMGWFKQHSIKEPNMADLLDLVALGTVADVVTLDHTNRILVEQGVRRIRAGACCHGITALIEQAKRTPARLVASDLGFAVGPRLNAAGRLEEMSLGIRALLTDSPAEAKQIAQQLDQLNQTRREIEQSMKDQALALLNRLQFESEAALPMGLCLYQPEWHQGVIGILASRVRESHHRPVIAFADAGDGLIKGSARSIPGLHIRDLLDGIATAQPKLLSKFGGHAMAAGLTLALDQFDTFRQLFETAVAKQLTADQLFDRIDSDGELQPSELNIEMAQLLRDAGPWGQNFPEPQFDGDFEVIDSRVVGEKHLKMRLSPVGSSQQIDAIAFNQAEQGAGRGEKIHAAYRLDINEFRGRVSPQLIVEYISSTN